MNGIFIEVEIADSVRGDAELAAKPAETCPVDIFAARAGSADIVEERPDECVLCELCVNARHRARCAS